MKDAKGAWEVSEALERIKGCSKGFTTTWFKTAEATQQLCDRHQLFLIEDERAIALLRRDRDFYHLHHIAADLEALSNLLAHPDISHPERVLDVDLVGRAETLQGMLEIYKSAGFERYSSLIQMSKVPDLLPGAQSLKGIEHARRSEAHEVLAFLDRLLDPYAEQIPDLGELEKACEAGNILVARQTTSIVGVLYYQPNGLSAVLRYWFVDPALRNTGVGGLLMKSLFSECRNCKRIVLWVIEGNDDSINKYQHYGFVPQPLRDFILIKRPV